jgi:hypothetical protein
VVCRPRKGLQRRPHYQSLWFASGSTIVSGRPRPTCCGRSCSSGDPGLFPNESSSRAWLAEVRGRYQEKVSEAPGGPWSLDPALSRPRVRRKRPARAAEAPKSPAEVAPGPRTGSLAAWPLTEADRPGRSPISVRHAADGRAAVARVVPGPPGQGLPVAVTSDLVS